MTRASLRTRLKAASANLAVVAAMFGAISSGVIMAATPAQADARLVTHAYKENEVVRIDGRAGVQATIVFGKGEAIENVAVGDSQAWQITPNKRADLLFVKPLDAMADTNMTVVTNRHTYFFDLVSSAAAHPLYMLRFAYKDEADEVGGAGAASVGTTNLAGLSPAEKALAQGDASALPSDPAALNFSWSREGASKLLPARVYDDGISTYLLWPERAAVPAILVTNEQGDEGPVNYAVRGVTIVLEGVPNKIILRSGKAKAALINRPSQVAVATPVAEPLPRATAVSALLSASPSSNVATSVPEAVNTVAVAQATLSGQAN